MKRYIEVHLFSYFGQTIIGWLVQPRWLNVYRRKRDGTEFVYLPTRRGSRRRFTLDSHDQIFITGEPR